MTRRRLLIPFIPYAVVSLVQLVALFAGAVPLASATKPLLMPALLLALLWGLRTWRGQVVLFGGLGILFSWAGDVLLGDPGGIGFLLGLGGFFLAHLAYLVLFLRPLRRRRMPWPALVLVAWWVGLLLVLGPHLGVLFVPVAVYGLVLGLAASAAMGTNRLTATGGVLFLLSDTLLALKLFLPGFALWEADFLIMLLYVLGEGLIILGAARNGPTGRPS